MQMEQPANGHTTICKRLQKSLLYRNYVFVVWYRNATLIIHSHVSPAAATKRRFVVDVLVGSDGTWTRPLGMIRLRLARRRAFFGRIVPYREPADWLRCFMARQASLLCMIDGYFGGSTGVVTVALACRVSDSWSDTASYGATSPDKGRLLHRFSEAPHTHQRYLSYSRNS